MIKNTILIILSILLVAVVTLGCIIILNMNSIINDLKNTALSEINSSSNQIAGEESSIYDMVSKIKDDMDKQVSLISGYTITYGKPDAGTLMGGVTVTVFPKEYSENTSAQLFINNECVNMTRSGNSFNCTDSVKITGTYTVSVTFNNNGVNKTEMLPEQIDCSDFLQQDLQVTLGDITNNGSTIYRNLSFVFYSKSGESAVSAKIIAYYNGQEKWSQMISNPKTNEPQDYQAVIGDDDSGFEYDICFEVTDSGGFIYRYYYKAEDGSESLDIYDKSGNKIVF